MIGTRTSQLKKVIQFLASSRWRLLGLLLLTAVLSVLTMVPPLLMRAFIDRVITRGEHSLFLPLGICMVMIPLLVAVSSYLQTQGIAYVGQRFVFDLRCALYRHMLNMSLRFFGKRSTGMLVHRLMGDTGMVAQALSAQTIGIVSDLVCAMFAITATVILNWRLSLLVILIVAAFLLNYHFNIDKLRKASQSYWRSFDRLSGGVQNRLTASMVIKSFGKEDQEQKVFREQSETSVLLFQDANLIGTAFSQNTVIIQNLGRALLYFLGCGMVIRGDMSYGDVVAFTTFAMQLLGPAVRFSELAPQIQNVRVAIERILEIYSEQPEILEKRGAVEIGRSRGRIDFNHVTFGYEPGRLAVRDFDLHVQPGETVALVGPTGCGKSTLLLLLLRFFDVSAGSLKLDDRDIRTLRLKSLRAQFGIVLQEPLLFHVSMAENIQYSRVNASQAEIEAAAKIAEIHNFIQTLPDRYQTVLGSEGLQLSVGQKQRLTIARAILADPAVLIMDEATSSLDSESEHAIQLAMRRVLRNRTAFIVAHRLSTIRDAHRIVVMRDGGIMEIGSHDELMTVPGGQYRQLYEQHVHKGIIEDDKDLKD